MNNLKIGNLELTGNVILAPMAGITDKAFRLITKPFGVSLMYTEMVSGKGLFYNNQKTEVLLEVLEEEKPVGAQIFGHDPEILAQIAYKALENGAELIDINMGCPAPKIVNNGDGSALMKTPKLAGDIIKAVVRAVNVPVTVKFRKGYDENNINAVEFAKAAEQSGAYAITVHGRTREQFYSGHADLDIIKKVKECVKIPVIGNGDIVSGKTAKHILDYTGCDGIMIGRASQGNPWVFEQVIHYLETGEELPPPSIDERMKKALEHIELLVKFKGEHRGIQEARKHMAWYLKGIKGGARLRNLVNKSMTLGDVRKIVNDALEFAHRDESY